jgi:hypothetical protein
LTTTAAAIPTGDARGWSGRSSNCPSSSRNYACAASLSDGSIELSRHPGEHVEGPRSRLCHGSGPPETSRSQVGLIGYRPVSQTESRQSITVTSSLERRQFRLAHLPAASWPIGPSGAAGMTLQVLDNISSRSAAQAAPPDRAGRSASRRPASRARVTTTKVVYGADPWPCCCDRSVVQSDPVARPGRGSGGSDRAGCGARLAPRGCWTKELNRARLAQLYDG